MRPGRRMEGEKPDAVKHQRDAAFSFPQVLPGFCRISPILLALAPGACQLGPRMMPIQRGGLRMGVFACCCAKGCFLASPLLFLTRSSSMISIPYFTLARTRRVKECIVRACWLTQGARMYPGRQALHPLHVRGYRDGPGARQGLHRGGQDRVRQHGGHEVLRL